MVSSFSTIRVPIGSINRGVGWNKKEERTFRDRNFMGDQEGESGS